MRKCFLCLGILATFGVLGRPSFGGSEGTYGSETTSRSTTGSGTSVPTFTLNQAILTSLQRNPTLLNAEQEIKRTRGVIIQIRAQALPQIDASGNDQWTDPNRAAPDLWKRRRLRRELRGPERASLMQGLPSQTGEVEAQMAAATATPESRIFRQANAPTRSASSEPGSFLTAQLSIRSGARLSARQRLLRVRRHLDSLIARLKTRFIKLSSIESWSR